MYGVVIWYILYDKYSWNVEVCVYVQNYSTTNEYHRNEWIRIQMDLSFLSVGRRYSTAGNILYDTADNPDMCIQ